MIHHLMGRQTLGMMVVGLPPQSGSPICTFCSPPTPPPFPPGDGAPGDNGPGSGDDGNDCTFCPPDPGSFGNDNIITDNPKVQYPDSSNYAEKYPKLTEYLRNKLPKLKDNKIIIDAIVKYGDLSASKVKEQLQWGNGPIIRIVELDDNCGKDCYGQYRSNDLNSLYIDIDLVVDLENTTLGSGVADAFSFLVGVTVLHEYVHFSEYTDGSWNNSESGELFETDVYGQTVWRSNASIILKSN